MKMQELGFMANGGRSVEDDCDYLITHIFVSNDCDMTGQAEWANAKVLKIGWIQACLDAGSLVAEKDFEFVC